MKVPFATRRQFLTTAAGAALSTSCRRRTQEHPAGKTPTLTKFVDPLPIPAVAQPVRIDDGVPFYEIGMGQFEAQVHRDLRPGLAWGYGDARKSLWSLPGPTFENRSSQPIRVHWRNLLPSTHLLPVDRTLNMTPAPDVRTVVHLHGSRSHPASDGHPNAWFTPEGIGQTRGPQYQIDKNQSEIYEYPNDQRATVLFYHDHAMGVTRLNVHAGLSGFYFIRDDYEDSLLKARFPAGLREIPLVLQDRILNNGGPAFHYPSTYDHEDNTDRGKYLPIPEPSVVPEFFGDAALVNGKAWPYLNVDPAQYRFRILNGAPSRFFRLSLIECDAAGNTRGRMEPGPRIIQIGSDGGFLSQQVMFGEGSQVDKLLLAPGERADVLVDFSAVRGRNYVLWNDAVAPFPAGEPDSVLTPLMMLKVRDIGSAAPTPLPKLERISRLEDRGAFQRDLVLSEDLDDYGRMRQRLGTLAEGPLFFHQPVTERPRRGSTEIWRFFNTSEDTHPMHIHLAHFQVLGRQPFDAKKLPEVVFTGPAQSPDLNERGWKDVVRAAPGYVTSIIVRFDSPDAWIYDAGQYMWHCHMLEHEDHDMMRPFQLK